MLAWRQPHTPPVCLSLCLLTFRGCLNQALDNSAAAMDAEAAMTLQALPDDLLVHIFHLLDHDDEQPPEQAR